MKRNFDVQVKDYEGRPFVRPTYEYTEEGLPVLETEGQMKGMQKFKKHEPLTLRTYALDALAGRWRGEDSLTIKQMTERIKLYDKIAFSKDGVVDIDNDESQMILDCLNKQGREPLIIARMSAMLNSDPQT